MNVMDKIKQFIFNLNEKGIPLPLIRDPNTDSPSVTMTMMLVAFAVAVFALIGKIAGLVGSIDISGANYLFLTTAGLYLGRRMTSDGKKGEVQGKEEEK